ncbi:Siderophore transport protein [Geobacillus stearothermophilus]|uniref:Siderophore transport protein n=1 Tax=Geobacillus stearothermophilus TaxID=1422 RepID=A0ABQ7HI89_GEOSE|nr:Siderophore transport protein [Geobacillus stearothermophilus]
MFPDEEEASRCLGTVETANTFGKVLSPILGAMLAGIIWFFPFFRSLSFACYRQQ